MISWNIEEVKKVYNLKTIAVVGLSKDPTKDSHDVAAYLKQQSYKIIPINPTAEEILGEKAFPSLKGLPENLKQTLDIVDVFRKSEDIPPIANEALELRRSYDRPQVFWMQLGISNEMAARSLREGGIQVIENACMMATHRLLFRK